MSFYKKTPFLEIIETPARTCVSPILACESECFRLANIVEGKVKQQFDKDGILFIDEDPKDFVYILRWDRCKVAMKV